MSILDQAEVPERGPIFATIAGDPGMGKSSLAALFPDPIFLSLEHGGVGRIHKDIRPKAIAINNMDKLKEAIKALASEEHGYKTIVIDTITALEEWIITDILENDPKKPKSINQALGGYGNGPSAVAARHQSFVRNLRIISERKGVHIIFVAHSDTEQIDLPDQDPYMRYSFRMSKKSIKPYLDEVGLVGFIRLKTFLKSSDASSKKKAFSPGDRLLDCTANAWSVGKNCYGIKEPLVYEEFKNPLVEHIAQLREEK